MRRALLAVAVLLGLFAASALVADAYVAAVLLLGATLVAATAAEKVSAP